MVNHCVVVGCTNQVGKKPGLSFHRFPSEKEGNRREDGQLLSEGKNGSLLNTLAYVMNILFQVNIYL